MRTHLGKFAAILAIGLIACGLLCQQAQAQGPIIGNITFAGSVNLNTGSASNATQVTGWHGLATGDLPQVQSRDGSFTAFVTPGDGTTFHAPPWSFNSGPISNFWAVDGFTFNLTISSIVTQTGSPGSGAVTVAGTGTVSKSSFTTTNGTWNFTTQDPSADSKFSFSAATAVPEASTVALFAIGLVGLVGRGFLRRKN
jgi:hypothetical protein